MAFGEAGVLCGLYQEYLEKKLTLEEAQAAWTTGQMARAAGGAG